MTEQHDDDLSGTNGGITRVVGDPVKQRSRTGRNVKLIRLGSRHVAGGAWTRVRLLFARGEKKEAILEARRMANSVRLYETLGDMKGLMMKLGQIMSFVDETMPPEYKESLAQLQRAAPAMKPALVHEVFRAELGASPTKIFASFDDEPVASASIGQVHRATMRGGREVAVKVQYPGVDDAIRADMQNMKTLYALISMAWKNLDPEPVLAEVRERIWEELDYRYEAENQKRFHEIYQNHPFIRVPGVVEELSTRRILTQDFVRGRGFYEVLDDPQELKDRYGEVLYRFVFGSMHMFGIFNGDPHPGNYFFHDDGSVTFVDYGAVKYFSESRMADLVAYVLAGTADDPDAFAAALKRVGFLLDEHEKDVSIEELHRILSFHFDPIREDAPYTYSTSWAHQTFKQGFMPNKDELDSLKHLSLPPDLIMLNRIQAGLNSILGLLGATANWHRIAAEYHSGRPASTELGKEAAGYFTRWEEGRRDAIPGKRYLSPPRFSTAD